MNKEIVFLVLRNLSSAYLFIPDEFFTIDIVKELLYLNPYTSSMIPKRYFHNKKFLMEILDNKNVNISYRISKELLDDKQVILKLVDIDRCIFNISDRLSDDDEILNKIINVKTNDLLIYFMSDRLHNINMDRIRFQNIYQVKRDDKYFILNNMDKIYNLFYMLSSKIKNDKEVIRKLISYDGEYIMFASNSILDNEELIFEAIDNFKLYFQSWSPIFISNLAAE